jgi:tRNA-dihydrouridine synthase
VKTRLGYDSIVITDWVQELLELEPAVISLHGRTMVQHYKGEANWDVIAAAAEIVRKTDTLILGNGDIHSLYEAAQRIRTTGVHGVLIGRASYSLADVERIITDALDHPYTFSDEEQDAAIEEPQDSELDLSCAC